jgi:hypothetical protein
MIAGLAQFVFTALVVIVAGTFPPPAITISKPFCPTPSATAASELRAASPRISHLPRLRAGDCDHPSAQSTAGIVRVRPAPEISA